MLGFTSARIGSATFTALVLVAACGTSATSDGGGGKPGFVLGVGGALSNDCSPPPAGEATVSEAGAGPCASGPVDYVGDVLPILTTCRGEVCHDFSEPSNVRALIAMPADECCNQRELVAPGHPRQSYLLDKLRGQHICYGARMPLERPPLPASDIDTLAAWICQGAKLP